MTSIDTHCAHSEAGGPSATGDSRKSVLFCPGCGYESTAGENWIVRSEDDTETFVCPDCATTVATR